MSLDIVFIGAADTAAEIKHIAELRAAGHDVFVPPMDRINYQDVADKLWSCDEIHIWIGTVSAVIGFYLGMVWMVAYDGSSSDIKIKTFNMPEGDILGRLTS